MSVPTSALWPFFVGAFGCAAAIGVFREPTPLWGEILGVLAGFCGVATWASYFVNFNRHLLDGDRWSGTRAGKVGRWVLINGWRLACLLLGLAVGITQLLS